MKYPHSIQHSPNHVDSSKVNRVMILLRYHSFLQLHERFFRPHDSMIITVSRSYGLQNDSIVDIVLRSDSGGEPRTLNPRSAEEENMTARKGGRDPSFRKACIQDDSEGAMPSLRMTIQGYHSRRPTPRTVWDSRLTALSDPLPSLIPLPSSLSSTPLLPSDHDCGRICLGRRGAGRREQIHRGRHPSRAGCWRSQHSCGDP